MYGRRCDIWGNSFIKHIVLRHEKFIRIKVVNPAPTFAKRISNKNAFSTMRLEFIRIRE